MSPPFNHHTWINISVYFNFAITQLAVSILFWDYTVRLAGRKFCKYPITPSSLPWPHKKTLIRLLQNTQKDEFRRLMLANHTNPPLKPLNRFLKKLTHSFNKLSRNARGNKYRNKQCDKPIIFINRISCVCMWLIWQAPQRPSMKRSPYTHFIAVWADCSGWD